ncbi:uncharacterized protein [Labrus bergylta]|uniref:uncharacterized protein n=1 Tax=Labrus bergylta TaxID=56723 RepID=UPI0033137FDE
MSTADQLLEKMFSWIEQREQCARKLKKLAQELESLREKCNASEVVGSSVAVVGAVCLLGAGVATLCTGGAAAPLLGLAGGVYSGVGLGISVITKITEHLSSSDTMKEAKEIESQSNEITKKIQKLFQKLKEERQQAGSFTGPDDLDRHVMTEILGAMARRSGMHPHFIMQMLQRPNLFFNGGPGSIGLNQRAFNPELMVGLAGILSFFTLTAGGKEFQFLFAKGGQQLFKEVSKTGLKTVLKGGAMAVGGVIGIAFELPEAINQWKDLIEKNHVTEASQSLRDTANDLEKISRTLREQLDKIKKMFKEFQVLKSCIENSNRSPQQKRDFIEIVKRYCQDQAILSWLSENYDTEIFFKLVDIFYYIKQMLDKKKKKTDRENIDIIFVAHGSIEEPLMTASSLLPLSTIEDVILYSPWNSLIDSKVAYGIIKGSLQPHHRTFGCPQHRPCQIHYNHPPTKLPPYWNSMKNAGAGLIPNIFVEALKSVDPAWNGVVELRGIFGQPGTNRVFIPYRFPLKIPFYVVTLALSLVLFIFPFRATVHLAACLGRSSEETLSGHGEYLNQQYSCTIDGTYMSSADNMLYADPGLYGALQAWFDQ